MIFMVAGEMSGDLHGARIAEKLSDIPIKGVAGPKMRAAGVECLIPTEEFQLMGFTDVVKSYPRLRKQFYQVLNAILEQQPKVVIMIDYPGFNMKLAKELRNRGFQGKLVQYICPKVWAWRAGRIDQLAETLDLLMVIFPFEVPLFQHTNLRVEYIGNPLTELHEEHTESPTEKLDLALFPGSRKSEIQLNLPHMLKAAEILGLKVGLSVANDNVRPLIGNPPGVTLFEPDDSYTLMRSCRAALATSGTVTLELALQGVPSVVVYRLSLMNAFLAGCIFRIKLPFYSLANIVAQKELFPELMHYHFTAKNAAEKLQEFLSETPKRAKCIAECQKLHEILKAERPSEKGAELIRELYCERVRA